MANELYYGDNLAVLRESIANESVDLIYLDPPFNSNASYNVLFKSASGEGSQAQIEAFEDTWHWNESAERAFDEVVTGPHSDASIMLRAMRTALGENDMMAYLAMMAVRLIELYRVLKPTGSLYLHCDPTASHCLRILLDSVFAADRFCNEIIWKRTGSHNSSRRFGPVHDVILYYAKSDKATWNQQRQLYDDSYKKKFGKIDPLTGGQFQDVALTGPGEREGPSGQPWRGFDPRSIGRHWQPASYLYTKYEQMTGKELKEFPFLERLDELDRIGLIYWPKGGHPRYKQFLSDAPGLVAQDVWTDIDAINSQAQERLGYPTQKPVALLERIISASSNEGDLVLDPFCGCGTTVHAAQKLNRQWIGIDVTHLAIALVERRLKESFPGITYDVHGVPTDVAGARDLAERDKHQFQMWITAKIGAQPYKGGKKGMDRGIDGYLHFRDADKKPQFAIISVKGGGIKSGDIRDLKGTMEREKAALGLFLTLNEPTREMERVAAATGIYETGGMKVPRLQILTAAQILDNRRPQVPFGFTEGFKKAGRESAGQERLL
jgi:site-specific DNA-methyltransferase (adenine-specific)